MTPEEKEKARKSKGGEKEYNKASDSEAVEEFLELDFVANIEE